MRFRRLLNATLFLLAMLPFSARSEDGGQIAPAAAATRFVALLDAGTVDAAWHEFTPLAQIIKSAAQWQCLQQSLRTAYGPLEQRSMRGVTLQSRYAMLPDGRYAIVQFDTVFRNKRAAIETIVLIQNQDSRWQIYDYINN
jgi:hypothetical protein